MNIKEPLLSHAEHTNVTRDCSPSYFSSSVDGVVKCAYSDLLC